ncbi:MAG TPA: hypothetical protein VFC37_16060 [Terracidiphilus sp.]|nr:hypothetical protein [Terracidiphilus sp.]
MRQSNAADPGNVQEAKLPRRDLIILPLLSLLTLAVCLLAAEAAARYFFVAQRDDSCSIDDSNIVFRYRANCTTHGKAAEGPWVTHQFNDCGYRTKESCGPKPPGTTRIALVGASVAEGYLVAYDETFAARAARQLTLDLGRPIEIQNMGREQCYAVCAFRRVDEALALKPDLILLAVNSSDFEKMDLSDVANRFKPMQPVVDQIELRHKMDPRNPLNAVQDFVGKSRAGIAALHFLFQNPATYVRMYLISGERSAYLRRSSSPAWEKRLDAYDLLLDEMAQKARDANVPIVLMEVPTVAQASLVSMSTMPPGLDPYTLDRRLAQITARHGIQFIDALDAFKQGPPANKLFYVVDGHLNSAGHGVVSSVLVAQLEKEQSAALLGQNEAQRSAAPAHGR